MLLCKVKKKERKQLLLILYRLPWGFPENGLILLWESVSDWNFTWVFSKLGASGRYLRGMDPGWVAEYLQLSQSLQVPRPVLQALGLSFTLSMLNLFMCNSSGKACIKLIWSRIIEWHSLFWFWSGMQHFPPYWEIGLQLGSFQDSKRKVRKYILASEMKLHPPFSFGILRPYFVNFS